MDRDILIVPDIHGRDFWLPALDYKGEIIFLGDYTDPYPAEGFTDEDSYQILLKVIKFKQENPDRVTLLIGNHEMHYYNKYMAAGRFSYDYYDKFNELLTNEATKDLFQVCKKVDKYLFIHAGIIKKWYDLHYNDFKDCGSNLEEQLNNAFFSKMHIFYEASRYRYGIDDAGSPLWADGRELYDEKEKGEHFDPEIIQIVGHTPVLKPDPLIEKNFWLVDNKKLYLLHNNALEKYIR